MCNAFERLSRRHQSGLGAAGAARARAVSRRHLALFISAKLELSRVNLSDEFRDGPPFTAVNNKNINVVRRMIGTEKHVTYHKNRASLGIGKTQIQLILHKHLGMKKLCSRWIPQNLPEFPALAAPRISLMDSADVAHNCQRCRRAGASGGGRVDFSRITKITLSVCAGRGRGYRGGTRGAGASGEIKARVDARGRLSLDANNKRPNAPHQCHTSGKIKAVPSGGAFDQRRAFDESPPQPPLALALKTLDSSLVFSREARQDTRVYYTRERTLNRHIITGCRGARAPPERGKL
ncbi:hypothetical protein EVAR_19959_1 [Eumeta japonica]|uniref:Uncharacterized protein n=1 Tax=Eumeta variegata TaxID=151549 RepID=A0A4C1YJS5_EUMVA|nr:hypothetical protein EVAR_19959_1 [Eumeta japonica]